MSQETTRGINSERPAGLYVGGVLMLAGLIATSGLIVLGGTMQVAAAAAPSSKDGQCNKQHQYCIRNTPANLQRNCERLWWNCVNDKCDVQPRTNKCVKDSDCATSCTEAATSKDGIISCCFLGPKHKNSCLKKIDNKCLAPGQTSPYFSGPKIDEGVGRLSDQQKALGEFLIQKQDSAMVVPPSSLFSYPEGTTFDEKGLPSQAPSDNPTGAGKIFSPNDPSYAEIERYLIENPNGKGENWLPPEYRSSAPYVPSTGERVFVLGGSERNPIIYSVPAESLSESELKLHRDYPVYPPETQRAPVVSNPGGTFPASGNTQNSQPASNVCRVSLFSWCFWH